MHTHRIIKFKYSKQIEIALNDKGNGILIISKPYSSIHKSKLFRNYQQILKALNVDIYINSKHKLTTSIFHRVIVQSLKRLKILTTPNPIKVSAFPTDTQNSNRNSLFHKISTKLFLFLFIALIITITFIFDYQTVKDKILNEHLKELNQLEIDYKLNKCEEKGHLLALKTHCDTLKYNIILHSKNNVTTISIFIIWIVDNANHIHNIVGFKVLIIIALLFLFVRLI